MTRLYTHLSQVAPLLARARKPALTHLTHLTPTGGMEFPGRRLYPRFTQEDYARNTAQTGKGSRA